MLVFSIPCERFADSRVLGKQLNERSFIVSSDVQKQHWVVFEGLLNCLSIRKAIACCF